MPLDLPNLEQHATAPIVHEKVIEKPQNVLSKHQTLRAIAKRHLKTMSKRALDKDWKLNDFFKRIVVINLVQATARKNRIIEQKKMIGNPTFRFFKAIDGKTSVDESIWKKFTSNRENYNPDTDEGKHALERFHKGEAGCYLSHYSVIRHTKECFDKALQNFTLAKKMRDAKKIKQAKRKLNRYSRILILEDDAAFGLVDEEQNQASPKKTGYVLRKALAHLPDDWNILYFMVHATKPSKKVSVHLRKLTTSWSAVAYAINYTMYDALLGRLETIFDPKILEIYPIDTEISELQKHYKTYAIYPSIVYHQDGTSAISGRFRPELWQGQPTMKKAG